MKAKQFLMVLAGMLLIISSCKDESSDKMDLRSSKLKSAPAAVCGQSTVELIAGQSIVSGNVTISNDKDYLYVTYTTKDGWMLKETHLYIGQLSGLPLNSKKVPVPGKFTYNDEYNPLINEITYQIPLSSISANCFIVAAHAVVVKGEQEETAWSFGKSFEELFGITRWGFITEYCKEDCNECVFNPVKGKLVREGYNSFNGPVGELTVDKDEANQQYVLTFKLDENFTFYSNFMAKQLPGYWGFFDYTINIWDSNDQLVLSKYYFPWGDNVYTFDEINKHVENVPFSLISTDCFKIQLVARTKLMYYEDFYGYDYEPGTWKPGTTSIEGTYISVCKCQ